MRIKIKPGEKVTVELQRKKPKADAPKPKVRSQDLPATGIMRPRREQDYLARRRRPQKGLIFYDLGVIKNDSGDWVDYKFAGTADESGSITPASFAAKAAAILSHGVSNLPNKFRRITKENAGIYELRMRIASGFKTLSASSEFWSEDGKSVKLDPEQLESWFAVFKNPFFFNFNFGTGAPDIADQYLKITTVENFGTEDPDQIVENIFLDGSETFFLCPVFCRATARTSGFINPVPVEGATDPQATFLSELRAVCQSYPRIALSNLFEWFNSSDFFVFNNAQYESNILANYEKWWMNQAYLKTLAQATLHYLRYDNLLGGLLEESFDAAASFPKHHFPAPPALPNPSVSSYNGARDYNASWSFASGAGDLIAIVKKGSAYYYVWWNTNE
jgi:hypothetical protein